MLLDWIDVKHSNWDENIEVVRSLYNTITSSDLYADYVSGAFDAELPDMDDYDRDREWWRRAYKKFIQNNDEMDAFLEEKSLYWNDDKDIVDTFVLKTISRNSFLSTRTWRIENLLESSSVLPSSMQILISAI